MKIYYLFWVLFFLIKSKGHFEIDMMEDFFDKDYYVDKDNEDNYIKTTFWNLICDIYECNK